jgi:hypothetical protein
MDDTWLKESVFKSSMDEMLLEKLYGHDQKKMVQKVDMGKEPEEKMEEIRTMLLQFYQMIGAAQKNVFGYVALSNFNRYLRRI